jgi:hypothetical protein
VAWSLGKNIGVIVLVVLMVLRSKVVFLEVMDPVGHLPLEVFKLMSQVSVAWFIHRRNSSTNWYLMEVFQCLHEGQ